MGSKGWFGRERTLKEQMRGIGLALAQCEGRQVLDLGCAEGLIAMEFVLHGAKLVHACDNNAIFVRHAQQLAATDRRMTVSLADLNDGLPRWLHSQYDIVLALAILHKLREPEAAIRMAASAVAPGGVLVIRLPVGSDGEIRYKHDKIQVADTRVVLPEMGLRLEADVEGPRTERVHYWRKA